MCKDGFFRDENTVFFHRVKQVLSELFVDGGGDVILMVDTERKNIQHPIKLVEELLPPDTPMSEIDLDDSVKVVRQNIYDLLGDETSISLDINDIGNVDYFPAAADVYLADDISLDLLFGPRTSTPIPDDRDAYDEQYDSELNSDERLVLETAGFDDDDDEIDEDDTVGEDCCDDDEADDESEDDAYESSFIDDEDDEREADKSESSSSDDDSSVSINYTFDHVGFKLRMKPCIKRKSTPYRFADRIIHDDDDEDDEPTPKRRQLIPDDLNDRWLTCRKTKPPVIDDDEDDSIICLN